jgi:hypothetical protein
MISVLTILGAVSALLSAFVVAVFMTDRHERAVDEPPPTEAPPVHVRVIRKDQPGAICH